LSSPRFQPETRVSRSPFGTTTTGTDSETPELNIDLSFHWHAMSLVDLFLFYFLCTYDRARRAIEDLHALAPKVQDPHSSSSPPPPAPPAE